MISKKKHFFMSFFLIGLNLAPRDFPLEKSPEVEVGLASMAKMEAIAAKHMDA